MAMEYHQRALYLLPEEPGFSAANAAILDKRERYMRRSFPAAVREWYTLEGSVELLRTYSNSDNPVPLEELGRPVDDWYESGPRNLVADSLLWFMWENQGVCNWAVRLDGTADPPVVVERDSGPHEVWQPAADSFSDFVFCQIWDFQPAGARCGAGERGLAANDLEFLRRTFTAGVTTYGWPGATNYRFHTPWGRILIWHSPDGGTYWNLVANSGDELQELIRAVSCCANLRDGLEGCDEAGRAAVARVRER